MRTSAQGCTVQVHLWDGNPHGIRVLSRAGWDGYLVAIPRDEVDAARAIDKVWDRTSAVVLLGQVGNGRVLVRISHTNSPEKYLETLSSGQWSRMFVLGRESAFSQVIARQCAIGLIQRVRSHEQAEVVDTYPTPPRPISRTAQNDVDTYIEAAVAMFGLCAVELFGDPPTTEQATQQCERPAPKRGGRASSSAPERTTDVSAAGEKAQYDEDMQLLLRLGLLKPSQVLRFPQPRKGLTHKAIVESDGTLRFQNTRYHSPTGAANAAAGTSNNGWLVWRLADGRNLDALRAKARREMKRK